MSSIQNAKVTTVGLLIITEKSMARDKDVTILIFLSYTILMVSVHTTKCLHWGSGYVAFTKHSHIVTFITSMMHDNA